MSDTESSTSSTSARRTSKYAPSDAYTFLNKLSRCPPKNHRGIVLGFKTAPTTLSSLLVVNRRGLPLTFNEKPSIESDIRTAILDQWGTVEPSRLVFDDDDDDEEAVTYWRDTSHILTYNPEGSTKPEGYEIVDTTRSMPPLHLKFPATIPLSFRALEQLGITAGVNTVVLTAGYTEVNYDSLPNGLLSHLDSSMKSNEVQTLEFDLSKVVADSQLLGSLFTHSANKNVKITGSDGALIGNLPKSLATSIEVTMSPAETRESTLYRTIVDAIHYTAQARQNPSQYCPAILIHTDSGTIKYDSDGNPDAFYELRWANEEDITRNPQGSCKVQLVDGSTGPRSILPIDDSDKGHEQRSAKCSELFWDEIQSDSDSDGSDD